MKFANADCFKASQLLKMGAYTYFQKKREKQSGDNIHFHANKMLTCKTELHQHKNSLNSQRMS